MARIIFLLLVLANLGVYVWAAGYLGGGEEGREPERLKQQLEPDRMKVSLGGTPKAVPAAKLACRRVGPLGITETDVLDQAIVAAGGKAERVSVDEVSYWVVIPATDGKPPDKDIAALKKSGFKQFSVVTDSGPNINSVDLGIFQTEAAAKDKVALLIKNNIKSARIVTLTKPTGQVVLNTQGPREALDKLLAGLNAQPVDCPKP